MQTIAKKTEALTQAAPAKSLQQLIKQLEPEIKKALPSVITPERFTRIALSAISTNPKLAECTPKSFLAAMMTSAQLGMEVNTPLGQAYLIPYQNKAKGVMECQFQLGYKGLIDLVFRSNQISTVGAYTVYEHDEFNYELGLEPKLKHIPAKGERGAPIYYYAIFRTKYGGYGFEVMSIEEMKAHRAQYSKAYNSPWDSAFDEMAKKTVLKRCLKFAPVSIEFARELSADETVKNTISDDMYLEPSNTITAEFADDTPTPSGTDTPAAEQAAINA